MIPPSKGPTIGIHQNDSFVKKGSAPSIKDRNILGPRSRAGLIAPLNYYFYAFEIEKIYPDILE